MPRPDDDIAAPFRRRIARKTLVVAGCGVGLGAMLLVVALNLDPTIAGPEETTPPPDITGAAAPRPLDDTAAARTVDDLDLFELPSGGWIQIAGDDGRLAQQYRFERLDPSPDGMGAGWVHMTRPELEVYLDDGRLVTLTGESALAYAPNRAVESGRMTGDVVIELFDEPRADGERGAPTAVVRTPEAELDNVLGRVHCPKAIHLESARGEFTGHEMTLLIDDQENVIKLLRVERVDFIRMVHEGPRPAPDAPERTADGTALELVFSGASDGLDGGAASPDTPPAASDVPFYLLTLHERVRIVENADRRTVARARAPHERSLVPRPMPGDTIITCAGGLTVVPLPDAAERLASARHARARLIGAPVILRDPAEDAEATCAALEYHVTPSEIDGAPADGRIELHAGDVHGLSIVTPRLEVEGHRFHLTRQAHTGGFSGPGAMTFRDAAQGGATAGPVAGTIAWHEGVTLTFAGDDADGLGTLERAVFAGAVRAEGDTTETLWAETLDARFVRRAPPAEDAGAEEALDDAGGLDIDSAVASGGVAVALSDGAFAFAERLELDARAKRATLIDDVRLADDTTVVDRGARLVVEEGNARYRLEGAGRMRRYAEAIVPPGADGPAVRAALDALNDDHVDMQLTWTEGVDVEPAPRAGEAGADAEAPIARLATVRGAVRMSSPELTLTHADEVRIHLSAADDGPDTVELIEASGGVMAGATADVGAMRAEHVRVELAPGPGGSPLPERLVASGDIELTDDAHTMWSDTLVVTFRPRTGAPDTGDAADVDAADAADAASDDASAGRVDRVRADVDQIRAAGDVQALLAGGERVFAERLEAAAADETAQLFGDRIIVCTSDYLLDNVTRLELDRRRGDYRVQSSGTFAAFAEPRPSLSAARRVSVPDVGGERSTEVSWNDHAWYHAPEESVESTLELHGAVHAESRPTVFERNTVDAGTLVLTLAETEHDGADDDSDEARGRTEPVHFVARGDARLESRTWTTPGHEDPPRVMFVSGPHIIHDQRTFESTVLGAGELLYQSGERGAADADATGAEPADAPAPAGTTPFSGRGTTLLRWAEKLHVTPLEDDVFDVAMTGDVTCIHHDPTGVSSTLTGQFVEARIARVAGAGDAPAAGSLDFGGPMEARRFTGRGGIWIDTPQREIACDFFEYDLDRGVAELRADEGRMVYVRGRTSAVPLRHERVQWNMREDTISVLRGGS